ncbi:PAS domain S-box protein [Nonomuraea sp. NPDC050556]|uniref:PAS domain S-box protein n=1 Tax=Nonomuraea sp. NPDC050556 TaxID=3364369 RepID=UPI003796D2EE
MSERRPTLPPDPRVLARSARITVGATVVALLCAASGLAGWLGLFPPAILKPNTVVGLLLAGTGLLLFRTKGRRVAFVCASGAVVVGALTVAEHLTGADLGIDGLLLTAPGVDPTALPGTVPGRMGLNTALAIALVGAAQLLLARGWAWTGQVLALLVMLLALLRGYGALYQVPPLSHSSTFPGQALHAALALGLLGYGTFLLRPLSGIAGLMTAEGNTALLGRWLLRTTMVVPPLLGWAVLTGVRRGLYDTRLGVALLVVGNVCVFTVVALVAVAVAARIERGRARAQDSLRELDWLRLLMDHTPAAIYMKDLRGHYLAVNDHFARLFHRPAASIAGLTAADLLPAADVERITANDRRAVEAGAPIQVEVTLHPPQGSRDYLTMLVPLRDRVGRVTGVCGIATDVTDRVSAQRERDRLQRRFAELLASAPDAMVITDENGVIQLVNAQAEAVFGYGGSELVGAEIELLMPDGLRDVHRSHRGAYTADPRPRPMGTGRALSGRRKDGTTFPVEISLAPLHTEDGLLISAAIRDVTTRQREERRRAELAAMVQTSRDAILALSPGGVVTFANPAGHRLYGYDELAGHHLKRLVAPEKAAEVLALLDRLHTTPGPDLQGERVETVAVTGDGREVDIELALWPVHDDEGRLSGISVSARDITARKRAAAELRRVYEQQRHVALTLQRSLMTLPPDLPDLPCARRYLPATEGAGIGGDWFDLIALGHGRIGVLIADVMGRGLEAAAVMGHLRPAAHALAKQGMNPAELLRALDGLVLELPEQMVTCCYLIVDPSAGTVTVASAGHLLPLLVPPEGRAGPLAVPVGVPLGIGGLVHTHTTLPLPDGATLALYTDGLVETPDTDIDARVELLVGELVAGLAETDKLEEVADQLLSVLLPNPSAPGDDVTLLLMQLPHSLPA